MQSFQLWSDLLLYILNREEWHSTIGGPYVVGYLDHQSGIIQDSGQICLKSIDKGALT